MSKRVVLFDADGFLLDFITPALEIASKVVERRRDGRWHGLKSFVRRIRGEKPFAFNINDFPTWDIFDTVGKEHERACYLEYEKPGFCASFEPYPDAVQGVREAKKMVDVVVVTSPLHSPTWCHERKQSLYRHFDIPGKDVIFAQRKTLVMGHMLVDDRPSHAEDWAVVHPHGLGVIWDQPYNRKHTALNTFRCHTWFGTGGLLEQIERVARNERLP